METFTNGAKKKNDDVFVKYLEKEVFHVLGVPGPRFFKIFWITTRWHTHLLEFMHFVKSGLL